MQSSYGTPHDLVEGLHSRAPGARVQCWDLLRPALDRLLGEWVRRHGLEQDQEVFGLYALHSAETYLRAQSPESFQGASWTAFRASVVLHMARVIFRPLGENGLPLVGPEALPESAAYHSETFFRPYERLADGWFGGDWFAGREGPDGALWVLLADVTGHGYPAHLLAGALPAVWRRCWASLPFPDPEPAHLLQVMHDLLADCLPEGIYLECVLARLRPDGSVTASAAGGVRLLLRRREAIRPDLLRLRGAWIGLRPPQPEEQHCWVLGEGDELLLATDGVFDQLDEVRWSVERVESGPLLQAVRDCVERALDHGPQCDDLTMVLLRRRSRTDEDAVPAAVLAATHSAGGAR